jgi:predicted nucleic acid-binding Zn ribbon protein
VIGAGRTRRLGDVLHEVLGPLGFEEALRAERAVTAWPRAVGDRLSRVARAAECRGGVLRVECDSPVWRQELQYHRETILQRLEEECGERLVRDLVFVLQRAPATRMEKYGQ